MIEPTTRQQDVAPEKKSSFPEELLNRIKKTCYSDDPVQTYTNLIQSSTQCMNLLLKHMEYMWIYRECDFDVLHQCSLEEFGPVFKQIHAGFQEKFNRNKTKRDQQPEGLIIYGYHAMEKCCRDTLQETDYFFAKKKQKVRLEEFMYIAYLITHRYLQNEGAVILATNFFLCDYHHKKYHKATGRKLNKHKLFFIVDKLFKAELISKRKIDTVTSKHQRVLYSLEVNNPFYGLDLEQ